MTKKKIVISSIAGIAAVAGIAGGAYAYNTYNRYDLKNEVVKIELGEELSTDASDYVDANERAIKETSLDFSQVDMSKAGRYKAKASYDDESVSFTVEIQDTIAPKYTVTNGVTYQNAELKLSDMIGSIEELSAIESITFSDETSVKRVEADSILGSISFVYPEDGDYTNTVTITDINGNTTSAPISIKVYPDAKLHVSGYDKQWVVEAEANIDFLQGVSWDEKIQDVTVDTSNVNMSVPGTYEISYSAKLDEEKQTSITNSVTVVSKETAQEKANVGETVYTDGNNIKEEYIPEPVVEEPVTQQSTVVADATTQQPAVETEESYGDTWQETVGSHLKPGVVYGKDSYVVDEYVVGGSTIQKFSSIATDENGNELSIEEGINKTIDAFEYQNSIGNYKSNEEIYEILKWFYGEEKLKELGIDKELGISS